MGTETSEWVQNFCVPIGGRAPLEAPALSWYRLVLTQIPEWTQLKTLQKKGCFTEVSLERDRELMPSNISLQGSAFHISFLVFLSFQAHSLSKSSFPYSSSLDCPKILG